MMNFDKMHPWHRTEILVGKDGLNTLKNSSVMVMGIGGVGSYACEALARAGVGTIHMVDFDEICVTNANRQLHAMKGTYGKPKVHVMKERLELVHPFINIVAHKRFYSQDSSEELLSHQPDVIFDAIDNMTAKTHLMKTCYEQKIPLLMSAGTANKLHPFGIRLADLHDTEMCPVAKIMRENARRLKIRRGIPVLFSPEEPRDRDEKATEKFQCICPSKDNSPHSCEKRNAINGTISYIPSIFGMMGAGLIVESLLGEIKIFNYCYPDDAKSSLREYNMSN